MPIYDLGCTECDFVVFDRKYKIEELQSLRCGECGAPLKTLVGKAAGQFTLKGTGWAASGYAHLGDLGK